VKRKDQKNGEKKGAHPCLLVQSACCLHALRQKTKSKSKHTPFHPCRLNCLLCMKVPCATRAHAERNEKRIDGRTEHRSKSRRARVRMRGNSGNRRGPSLMFQKADCTWRGPLFIPSDSFHGSINECPCTSLGKVASRLRKEAEKRKQRKRFQAIRRDCLQANSSFRPSLLSLTRKRNVINQTIARACPSFLPARLHDAT